MCCGLVKAAKRFDPTRNIKFVSFATCIFSEEPVTENLTLADMIADENNSGRR